MQQKWLKVSACTLAAICNIVSRCASFSIASTGTGRPEIVREREAVEEPVHQTLRRHFFRAHQSASDQRAQSRVRKGKSSNFCNGQTTARARQLSQQALLIFIQPRQSRIGHQHSDANSRLQFARTGGGLARDHPLGDQLCSMAALAEVLFAGWLRETRHARPETPAPRVRIVRPNSIRAFAAAASPALPCRGA